MKSSLPYYSPPLLTVLSLLACQILWRNIWNIQNVQGLAPATPRPALGGIHCIWSNCANKQNTTNLLLFYQADTGSEEPQARLTRYSSLSDLKSSGFAPQRPTLLMVHGFRGSGLDHQRWAIDMKDLVLATGRGPSNVLFADWSHHARVISYLHALEHIAEVTEDIYSVFENLEKAFPNRFRMTELHVIGHSLGAHVAGLLGQMMGRQLDQVTALDPTGILLNSAEPNLKLSLDDAKYVSALHTNAKYLGTEWSLADRDVFFNGGSDQPACKQGLASTGLIPATCSHRQATKYASTYMDRCVMVAYLCRDYETYLSGQCGFCPPNSAAACVGVGNEWQYAPGAASHLRPPKSDKRKSKGDRQWLEPPSAPRYHIRMAADRPYCVFTYQVVVKFADNSEHLDSVHHLDLMLRPAHSNRNSSDGTASGSSVWTHLSNRMRPDARLEVFSGRQQDRESLSGRYLFTGLLLVEPAHELYDRMPIKFTEASLVRSVVASAVPKPKSGSTTTSTTSTTEPPTSSRQEEQQLSEPPEVYVNFMSHPRFETRAAHSGRLAKVTFIKVPAPTAASVDQTSRAVGAREPRIESRQAVAVATAAAVDATELAAAAARRWDALRREWIEKWAQAARTELRLLR